MSWRETKDAGKQAFSEGKYPVALSLYSEAIDQLLTSDEGEREGSNVDNRTNSSRGNGSRSGPTNDHQVLLSNVIACRLKIGGQDMVAKAVDDAKQCVALNNKWPKAHVRLASAYIALGGHSNDACLSLQRALTLDRKNKVAREMLVKEMRQRNIRERTGSNNGGSQEESNGSSHNPDYHPTEETPQHFSDTPSAPPHPSATPSAPPHPSESTNNGNYDGIDVDDIDPPDAYYSLTISQRIQHHFAQVITWFYSQSDDIQTLLKVACCFLFLYVALGGRFGLDYALGGDKSIGRRGNYDGGNAYDRYSSTSSSTPNRYSSSSDIPHSSTHNQYSSSSDRHEDQYGNNEGSTTHNRQQQAGNAHNTYDDSQRRASSGYNDRTSSQNDRHYSRHEDERYYEPRGRRRSTSYQMPNLYDGSLVSIGIIAIIGIVCQRFGINPFQALGMLNLMQGRGGRHRMGRMGYGAYRGGMGGGMGGMGGGFGFGQRRNGFGRRGRGGFY